MTEIVKTPFKAKVFRTTAFASAFLLGSLGTWELSSDLRQPTAIEFPTDRERALSIYVKRDAAVSAAEVGLVRGDLWADAALAYGSLLWTTDEYLSDLDAVAAERIEALTERAIRWAPYDARLWLLLAAIYFAGKSPTEAMSESLAGERLSASLKMCYYTGLNTVELIQARLFLVLRSQSFQDDEIKELVRHDLRIAVARKAEFTPVIAAAYRSAPQAAKQYIENALGDLDPEMLKSIRAQDQSN